VKPYFDDGAVSLYVGDMREVVPALGVTADCVIADPPYGETSLDWDRWPDGWLDVAADAARSLWCFGSLRMYLEHHDEFKSRRHRDRLTWRLSQDIIWEKHNGSGSAKDRFKRVHEQPTHWYRGPWAGIYHETPTTADATARTVRRKHRPPHWGDIGASAYESEDGGPRLMRSVIYARSMHGRAIHKTQKPGALLEPMITYACPPGGLIIEAFAGSGSALMIVKQTGRRGIGIELREEQAEQSALWLSQSVLDFSDEGSVA
jgi:site-specific DNA-methyltransferase (adenine-specific)